MHKQNFTEEMSAALEGGIEATKVLFILEQSSKNNRANGIRLLCVYISISCVVRDLLISCLIIFPKILRISCSQLTKNISNYKTKKHTRTKLNFCPIIEFGSKCYFFPQN